MTANETIVGHQIDILVVEDSSTQARYLAQLLESEGYRVRLATDGREGLRAAREFSPTLIVSDIAMPEMDGFEMCRAIKQDQRLRQIPVILLTSLSSIHDVIKSLDCGADNFIRKPFESKYLLARVHLIIANRAIGGDDRVQLGLQISLGGQPHFITAERQQIFDLLISTYEEAIQLTAQLQDQQSRVAHSFESLEGLFHIAEALNPALNEQAVAKQAHERILDFPGVSAAGIKLFDRDRHLRTIAAQYCTVGSEMVPDCDCQRRLLQGALTEPEFIQSCQQIGQPHALIPLTIGHALLGVLCLLTDIGALEAEDQQVLMTVGNQIAVALERARLYGDMEAQVKERTEAWQSEHELLAAVVQTSGALVCIADEFGTIRLFNPACERSMGWLTAEVTGKPCWEVFKNASGGAGGQPLFDNGMARPGPTHVRGEWMTKDGAARSIIWSTSWLRKPNDSGKYFLATGVDVTDLRGAEERLHYLSNFDILTGLPNRILMRDRVKQLQDNVIASQKVMGFLLLKPERLGLIRESLGIEAEQAVLLQVAKRLEQWSHGEFSVARVGEDTFALIAVRNAAIELSTLAREVLVVMGAPVVHEQHELHIDACIGIALFPNDGDDYDKIAQGAEAAMRRAMGRNADRYEFYRPALNRGAHARFKFEGALRRALDGDEFLLHYQPQVSLASGTIIGVEALVRWQHPDLGLIPPGRFIGLAEETGLILPIGEWVLRQACKQSCAWQREGLPALPVAVNLSARQFSEDIVGTVSRILHEMGLAPQLLELELTESASMEDPKKTFEILYQLKAMGVKLSIDDFGTGYSNLSYLKRFPVDKLKLDQSFVKDITSDPDDLSISRAVIAMAHGLRLTVIAEGVETAGQLALLTENGCDEMQGYYFSQPVDASMCACMLRDRKSLARESLLQAPAERTLLYVDDEVNLLSAIKRTMQRTGYRVMVAADAATAFEILATVEVGVILCDQRMPGLSGTEFLSRVKLLYPDATRIVLSGYTDLQSVTDAVNRGAIFKFLTKPWDDDELGIAVRDGFLAFEAKRGATLPVWRP